MLCGKPIYEWRKIEHNWLSDIGEEENNILTILRLSYDHLSLPSLKKCFTYYSVFPKGSQMKREELIQLWMAEGFLQPSPTSVMENVGNKLFDLLVQSSLLHVVDRDIYNNVEHCIMHDLVHDVASSVLDFSKVNDNTLDVIYHARYIFWEIDGDESSLIMKEQSKWLRTLVYNGDLRDIIFSDFKSLHVLILIGNIEELSDSIREVIHLRFLNIKKTTIKNLPDSIGELYHLQTFKAPIWHLKKLPSTFKYLFNLRHLHMSDHTELPPNLGLLTSLQTLPFFKVRDVEGHPIVELGRLKNLKGELEISNLENVLGEEESNKACLLQKSGIVKLVLGWNRSRDGEINDQNVLWGLRPHSNLKILEINGFKGASFPSWTLKMEGLENLMDIKLEKCSECEEIPALGHLPHLKSIYLSDLVNVKSISTSFYGIDMCRSNNVFPALETLKLIKMPNLTEWVEVEIPHGDEVKVFSCLEYLKIEKCNKLKSAPSIFPCLKELDVDGMDSGDPLANICGIKLTSLVKLKISWVVDIVSLPDWLFRNNQHLSVLRIDGCHPLRELPDGLQTLNSLEKLTINYGDFESIPPLGHLPHLKSIYLYGLKNVKSLSTSFYSVEKCVFPALEKLELLKMPNLSGWADAEVQAFPCLKSLKILDCMKLTSTPGIFPCLKVLDIDRVESGIPLTNIFANKLTSLVQLEISTVVEMLRELPDGLQTLNSLVMLTICYCNNLKSIQISSERPSKGFTLLRQLKIGNTKGINVPCELLESCASSLMQLEICERVTNMPMVIECVYKMPCLVKLTMMYVHKFIISSPMELGSSRSLKQLSFLPDYTWDFVSFNNAANGILLMGSGSLQYLELKGHEAWESLPCQLQHLTALKDITLYDFGIEELPEWF